MRECEVASKMSQCETHIIGTWRGAAVTVRVWRSLPSQYVRPKTGHGTMRDVDKEIGTG